MKFNKNTFLTLFLACCSLWGFTKNDSLKISNQNFEIGINSSLIFDRALNIISNADYNNNEYENYLFLLKFKFIRLKVGAAFSGFDNGEVQASPYIQNINKRQNFDTNLKLGVEFNAPISKRFSTIYGGDIIFDYGFTSKTEDFNIDRLKTTSTRLSYGLSPFVGLQLNFNDKLSLTTETNWAFVFSQNIEKERSEVFVSVLGTTRKSSSNASRYQFPFVDVFLRYKF